MEINGTASISLSVQWWMKKGRGQATFFGWSHCLKFPSVHWHCWLGDRNGIWQPITKFMPLILKGPLIKQTEEENEKGDWLTHVQQENGW